MRRAIRRLLITGLLALTFTTPALADGIIIPEPPPGPEPPPLHETWLTIEYHRVDVTIEDQVATTHVEQAFRNEHDWEAEGTYVFPLPEGATVSNFAMWVDGERVEGEILQADEARQIYEDIVRRRRDPALLEYVGRNAVRARIFPIPPGESRKIELEYTQVLPVENGLVRYVYPLDTEKFSARPLEDVSVRLSIDSPDTIHALYSPTHQDRIFVERQGDYRAVVGYEASDILPEDDFELVYTVSQEDVGLNLLTYREPPDDGFFLLLAAPSAEVDQSQVVPRDVVVVLDTSGSMDGQKIEQAKDALAYILDHLNPKDRFGVIGFSTGVRRYGRGLSPTAEAAEAVNWVRTLRAVGGTDINRALLEALAQVGERPTVLIFLTDGLPTEGVTEIEQILANVDAAAPENVRLFPFGVGDDVNTVLLDTLAQQNRGATGYVRPHERIDEEISAFYAKIQTPVLTDITLDFGDVVAEDTYPTPLPDLFAGTQLILTGRYRGSGPTAIQLTGEVNGETREFTYEGHFTAQGGESFIPRLWATRKIGYLLKQIRLHGEKEEWVDAVIDLSVRYGIITPYTSFLIDEEDILTETGRQEAAEQYMAEPTPAAVGAPAAERADAENKLEGAESVGGGRAPMPEGTGRRVRFVGSKAFIWQSGVWIDTAFNPAEMTTQKIGFGSEVYFELLAARPQWGDYLALGDRVIFVAESAAYEIIEGEGDPVALPPDATATPESLPIEPTASPTPTPVAELPATPRPSSGSRTCAGSMALGLLTMMATGLWIYVTGRPGGAT